MRDTAMTKTAVIIGAGFSRSLGVPDYSQIMRTIAQPLDPVEYNLSEIQIEIDKEITSHIQQFLIDVFDCQADYREIPSLEKVFTFLDLSLKSGHNFGRNYYAGKVLALSRFLIYKLFLIIDKSYTQEPFMSTLIDKLQGADYVSLNWDIVLEQLLSREGMDFQYSIDEQVVEIGDNNRLEICENTSRTKATQIAKIHGSANWAYCDNCRKLFYMKAQKIAKVIQTGIYVEDIKRFYKPGSTSTGELKKIKDDIRASAEGKRCPHCHCFLGTHIATFSFNKAFRTHAFDNSWKNAEKILDSAHQWLFIGYSLPDADFEFEHLLKCVQKRTAEDKRIIAVVKDDKAAEEKYYQLFGRRNTVVFNSGIESFVKDNLSVLG